MAQVLGRFLIGVAAIYTLSAHSAVIYRWVDEQGRTHVSDVVPDKYRQSAVRTDSARSEVSPAQRRQAEQMAEKNRGLAEDAATRGQGARAAQPSTAASRAPTSRRPARGVTDATDCDTWRTLYRESLACFGPFRTANGATKAEAFEHCREIASPEMKCGPFVQ